MLVLSTFGIVAIKNKIKTEKKYFLGKKGGKKGKKEKDSKI